MDEEVRSYKFWDLVVVLLPEGVQNDVLEELEELMSLYDCALPVDVHSEHCGCVGAEAEDESFDLAVDTLLIRDPNRPWRDLDSENEEIWKLRIQYEKAHPLYQKPSPDCEECGGSGVGWEELCNRESGQWWEWEVGVRCFPGGRVEVPVEDLLSFWRRCQPIESLVTPDGQWHRKPWTAQRSVEPTWRTFRREEQLEHWWRRHLVRYLRKNECCMAVAVGAELARWVD